MLQGSYEILTGLYWYFPGCKSECWGLRLGLWREDRVLLISLGSSSSEMFVFLGLRVGFKV